MSNTPQQGLGATEVCRSDWTIPQAWERYTSEEHWVWKTLFQRQARLLHDHACEEFLQGLRDLPISPDEIPDFRRLSDALMKRTGWQLVAVPGLVPDSVYFEHLANRRFPTAAFIRGRHEIDYATEPDLFHDVFGHAPMLMNPVIAHYMQAYGEGGLRAQRLGKLPNLARLHMYTVEFGVVMQRDGLRVYGAGLASSWSETAFALKSPSPNRIRFELERVMCTDYHTEDLQETYFAIEHLDDLLALAHIDFGPIYERLGFGRTYRPGEVLSLDQVITQGNGNYHARREGGPQETALLYNGDTLLAPTSDFEPQI
jgi:phenylalanine-4-hydroxylase